MILFWMLQPASLDLLSVLLEWIADVHIKQMLRPGDQHCTPDILYDKFVKVSGTAQKATIHQVTTMLATSKYVLFLGHNYLLTTGTDDQTDYRTRAIEVDS